jgi:prepilin-type N-terminal cleavage/methylation domain-containing protein
MKARGFTLIELVIAITISAIVMVFVAMFIRRSSPAWG